MSFAVVCSDGLMVRLCPTAIMNIRLGQDTVNAMLVTDIVKVASARFAYGLAELCYGVGKSKCYFKGFCFNSKVYSFRVL